MISSATISLNPVAAFATDDGCDPVATYLVTTIDVGDTDEIVDIIGDRLVELQVEEGHPIDVAPSRP